MDDESSTGQSGRELVDTMVLLGRTDDFLIEMAREAVGHFDKQGSRSPIMEAQLARLEAARPDYQDPLLDTTDILKYLVSWPDIDGIWANLNRAIIRYYIETPERSDEWVMWLAQVERAGTATWHRATGALKAFDKASIGAFFDKLRSLDELLNHIHQSLHAEKRPQFASELDDTV